MAQVLHGLPAADRARIDNEIAHGFPPQHHGNSLVFPPRAPNQGNMILRRADGAVTVRGQYYLQQLNARQGLRGRLENLEFFPADAHRQYIGGAEYVADRNGNMRMTRRWDPGENQHRFTRLGRQWGHSSVRYEVMVPVTGHRQEPDGTWVSFTHHRDGRRVTVPVTSDEMGIPAGLLVARDVGDHERQKAFVQEAIRHYLSQQPEDERNGGVLMEDFTESDCYYSYEPAGHGNFEGFVFSEEFTEFRAGHAP